MGNKEAAKMAAEEAVRLNPELNNQAGDVLEVLLR